MFVVGGFLAGFFVLASFQNFHELHQHSSQLHMVLGYGRE